MPGRARTPRDRWTPRPADFPRACDLRRHPQLAGLEDNAIFRRMRMVSSRTELPLPLVGVGLCAFFGELAFLLCGITFLLQSLDFEWTEAHVSDPDLPLLLAAWARVASGFLVPRLESDVALRTLRLAADRRTMGGPAALEGADLASAAWGFVASTRRIRLQRILILSRIALVVGVLSLDEVPIANGLESLWILFAAVSLGFDVSRLAGDARAARLLERLATHPPRIEGGGELRMWLVRSIGVGLVLAIPPALILMQFAIGASPDPTSLNELRQSVFVATAVLLGFAVSRLRAPMIRKRAEANFALLSERLQVLMLETETAVSAPPGPRELQRRRRLRARGFATAVLLVAILAFGFEPGILGYHILAGAKFGRSGFLGMDDFGIQVRGPLDSHQRFFLKEGPTELDLGGAAQIDEVVSILRDFRSAGRIREIRLDRVQPAALAGLEMPSLQGISIKTGGLPADLSPLTMHPSLDFVGLEDLVQGTDLSVLVGLPRLDHIFATGDTDPVVLAGLPGPTILLLSGDTVARDVILAGPSSLEGISYKNNGAISLRVRSMDWLRSLSVEDCDSLQEVTLEGLCSLVSFRLHRAASLKSVTIRDCPRLATVRIGDGSSTGLPALASVVIDAPRLRQIEIGTSNATVEVSQIARPEPLPDRAWFHPAIRNPPAWFEELDVDPHGSEGWRRRPRDPKR